MSFGLFQEWGKTSNQGPKLKIANRWVFPSRKCHLDGIEPGMTVEYETTQGGNDGKLTILQRIRPAPAGSSATMGLAAASAQTGSTITDGDILRSVSNVVGNACAAGAIKTPEDLTKWFVPAYNGFRFMAEWAKRDSGQAQAPSGGQSSGSAPKDPPRREPGQDDEPLFDDSHEFSNSGYSNSIPPW